TIRYTAKSSIVPWILVAHPPDFQRLCHVYQDVAAENGRKLGLGESVGAFRAVHFGRNEPEAGGLLRDTNYAGVQKYFRGFGLLGGLAEGGGRGEVSARSVHAPATGGMDGRADAASQVRAGGEAGRHQAGGGGAADDRRQRRPRVVRLVLRPGVHVLGRGGA